MTDKTKQMLDDFAVNLEFTVRDLNMLLNMLDKPFQSSTTAFSYFINVIQNQAGPQVMKAKTDLETVMKSQEEKKDE